MQGPIFYNKVKMVLRIESRVGRFIYLRNDIGAQADWLSGINVEVGERDPQWDRVLDKPRLPQKPCEHHHDQLKNKDQP